jgi:hypothetical protein
MKYAKQTPRLTVKFVDGNTDKILFEVNDRTWMNVGEILNDGAISSIMKNEWKNKSLPKNLMVLVVGEYSLQE